MCGVHCRPHPCELYKTFVSLRNRNFRLFFIGQSISNTGNWLTDVALVLLVLRITSSGAPWRWALRCCCSRRHSARSPRGVPQRFPPNRVAGPPKPLIEEFDHREQLRLSGVSLCAWPPRHPSVVSGRVSGFSGPPPCHEHAPNVHSLASRQLDQGLVTQRRGCPDH